MVLLVNSLRAFHESFTWLALWKMYKKYFSFFFKSQLRQQYDWICLMYRKYRNITQESFLEIGTKWPVLKSTQALKHNVSKGSALLISTSMNKFGKKQKQSSSALNTFNYSSSTMKIYRSLCTLQVLLNRLRCCEFSGVFVKLKPFAAFYFRWRKP